MSILVKCGPKKENGERKHGSFLCNEKCYLWKMCCAEIGHEPTHEFVEIGPSKFELEHGYFHKSESGEPKIWQLIRKMKKHATKK